MADVEDLEVDEVLEVLGEDHEAVETSVEDTEGGEVGDGGWEGDELVGVDAELP